MADEAETVAEGAAAPQRRSRNADPTQVARFAIQRRLGAGTMARVAHPHMVAIYEAGLHDDGVYIAMELVTCSLVTTAGRASATSVSRGIAVIDEDHPPIDVASPKDSPGSSGSRNILHSKLTARGAMLGTPAYMSLEHFRGKTVAASDPRRSWPCSAPTRSMSGRSESSPSRPGPVPDHLLRSAGGRGPCIRHGPRRDVGDGRGVSHAHAERGTAGTTRRHTSEKVAGIIG